MTTTMKFDLPAKVNTMQLRQEIADNLGVAPEDVIISASTAGEIVNISNGRESIVPVSASLEVTVPDGSKIAKLVSAVESHAPEQDDHEEFASKEITLPGLLARIERIESLIEGFIKQ